MYLIFFYTCKVHSYSHKSFLRKLHHFSIPAMHKIAVCKKLHSFIIKKKVSFRFYIVSQFSSFGFCILCNKILCVDSSLNQHFYKLCKITITKSLIITAYFSFFVKVKQKQPCCHMLPFAVHHVKSATVFTLFIYNNLLDGRTDKYLLNFFCTHSIFELNLGVHFQLHRIAAIKPFTGKSYHLFSLFHAKILISSVTLFNQNVHIYCASFSIKILHFDIIDYGSGFVNL